MPRTSRDGVSIRYERKVGATAGRERAPVVFVGGLGFGRWSWRWQREAVREAGYDVIAPDSRGIGRSDPGLPPVVPALPRLLRTRLLTGPLGYSVEGLAADLDAVLTDAGVRDVHLVGTALGGQVALAYALNHSKSTAATLTLVATPHGGPDALPIHEEARQPLLAPAGNDPRTATRRRLKLALTDHFAHRNPHLLDRMVEWQLEQDGRAPVREAQLGALTGFDASDDLERIRVPTLVVHGTADRIVPVENGTRLAAALPESQFERIDGGAHLAGVENADTVTDTLLSFLAANG